MRLLSNDPRAIEKAMREPRDEPYRIQEYAAAADLPAAADWRNGIVRVVSINRLAFSDGSNWIRSDTGATL